MTSLKSQEKKFYSLLKNRLDIYYNYSEMQDKTLEELNLTKPEVDFFLNELERVFEIEISEEEIVMEIPFSQFIEIIRVRSRKIYNDVAH